MTRRAAFLDDRGVVRVSGEDAPGFLQGLLTNDVDGLGAARGALRRAADRRRARSCSISSSCARPVAAHAFLLDCPAALAADLAKRLAIYKLRAKVAIVDESADHRHRRLLGRRAGKRAGRRCSTPIRARRRLGHRAILPRAKAIAVGEASVGEYEALRISLGVPKGGVDFAYGDAFPHDADMDLFNGVDFQKGCYVGQEVVSRMKHRGEARKRVVRVRLDGPAPAPGTPVTDGELPVGALGVASGRHGAGAAAARPRRGREGGGADLAGRGVEVVVTEAKAPALIARSLEERRRGHGAVRHNPR